mmetsp:Transcript_1930/g.4897  ORF Transcript_1930/g.4897 Transcript_1930/m.4897 type:complete len:356 (+) Transcript_1930:2408-3475(+)
MMPEKGSTNPTPDFQAAESKLLMFVAMEASEATCLAMSSKAASPLALSPNAALINFRASSGVTSFDSAPSAAFCRVFRARSAMFLASGFAIFSQAAFTSGSNLGMSGTTALGSSTTLHMLSTMRQHVRFTSSTLSFRPRESTGSIAASAGASTFCTKMQPANFSTHTWVLSMDCAALTTKGRNGSRSLLPVQLQMAVMVLIAASFTSFLMSQVSSATGMAKVTSTWPMDLGDFVATASMICKVASFCGGLAFTLRLARNAGMHACTENGLIISMMAFAAATAASLTFLLLSPVASKIAPKAATRNGSAAEPFDARAPRPSNAAWPSFLSLILATNPSTSAWIAAAMASRRVRGPK